jgi:hypothetical protein
MAFPGIELSKFLVYVLGIGIPGLMALLAAVFVSVKLVLKRRILLDENPTQYASRHVRQCQQISEVAGNFKFPYRAELPGNPLYRAELSENHLHRAELSGDPLYRAELSGDSPHFAELPATEC